MKCTLNYFFTPTKPFSIHALQPSASASTITPPAASPVGLGLAESVNGLLAQVPSDAAINALVEVMFVDEVVLKDVQHTDHLREDEDLVSVGVQLGQQLVDQHQLARRVHECLEVLVDFPALDAQLREDLFLGAIDEVGVVAAFAQFHHGVHEVRHVRGVGALGQEKEVALEDSAVVLLLDVRQLHLHDRLLLRRQVFLHILLQSTQHHRL